MPLKPLGRAPYLLPDEIENDDLVIIIEKPYIVPAEKTKWGRERGKATVKIVRTDQIRTWSMNNSTWDKLIAEFGEDPELWLSKKVLIKKETRNISGVDKEVLYGRPYVEPQQQLDSPKLEDSASHVTVKNDLIEKIAKLSPEFKLQLLTMLQAHEAKEVD